MGAGTRRRERSGPFGQRGDEMGRGDDAAVARPTGGGYTRSTERRVDSGRLRYGVSGAEGYGGGRAPASRLFRRGARGHAVRAARCAGSPTIAARRTRRTGGGRSR